jgi:hypothetical protein
LTTDEGDPFDRVVAREIELRERQERREKQTPRKEGARAAAASVVGLIVLFPVTYLFARNVTWLIAIHVFLIACGMAALAMVWFLPSSLFETSQRGDSNRPTPGLQYRSPKGANVDAALYWTGTRAPFGGSLSFLVMLLVLLPLTLLLGRHITWLVITHVVLTAIALSSTVSLWFQRQHRSRT